MAIETINPATGETLKKLESHTKAQIDEKLDKAVEAYGSHRLTSFESRAECMRRAGEILVERKEELGRLMTIEMGKPIKAAIAEAEKCASACRYYAENAARFLADELVHTDAERSFIR